VSQTFGKKSIPLLISQQEKTSSIVLPAIQSRYLTAAIMAIGCIVSLYLWFFVYKVPIERPYAGLFPEQPPSRIGWASFWVAPLAAMLLGLAFSQIVRSTVKSLTIINTGMFSLLMVVIAGGLTSLIKNIGFVLYYVPGAGVMNVLSVLPTMASVNMSKGVLDLGFDAPELLLRAVFSAAGFAVMMRIASPSVD
jgi:intracellular septation protein A